MEDAIKKVMEISYGSHNHRFSREINKFIDDSYGCGLVESGISPMQWKDWMNDKWKEMTRRN